MRSAAFLNTRTAKQELVCLLLIFVQAFVYLFTFMCSKRLHVWDKAIIYVV